MDTYGHIWIHMDKYMDSPMGPWARPMGTKMAAGPWPKGPGSGSLAQGQRPSRHLGLAHGRIHIFIHMYPYISICMHIVSILYNKCLEMFKNVRNL